MMWNDLHMWPKWLFNGMFFFGGIIILIIYVSIDPPAEGCYQSFT